MHVNVQLFNLAGQNLATLFNGAISEGPHEIILQDVIPVDILAQGQ